MAMGLGASWPAPGADFDLRFSHLDTRDGLSENTVTAFAQDAAGFVWIGTQHGLNRFDGLHVDVYTGRSPAAPGLVEDCVNDLLVDSRGILWIATFSGGLNRYDPVTGRCSAHGQTGAPQHRDVTTLAEDALGRIWAGTTAGGVLILDPSGAMTVHRAGPGSWLPSDQVTALEALAAGWMAVGTADRGAVRVQVTGHSMAARPLAGALLNDAHVTALLQTADGALWIGTHAEGLVRVDADGALRIRHHPQQPASLLHDTLEAAEVRAVMKDPHVVCVAGTPSPFVFCEPESGLPGCGFSRISTLAENSRSVPLPRTARPTAGERCEPLGTGCPMAQRTGSRLASWLRSSYTRRRIAAGGSTPHDRWAFSKLR